MRILLIHNRYQLAGGEDFVFKVENELFSSRGHEVETILFDNTAIKSFLDKCKFGLLSIYNPSSARQLRAKIAQFNPDVIHVHNFFPLASPSIFITAGRMGVPVVLTLHNYRLLCPSATLVYEGAIYEKSVHSIFPWDAIWKGVYRGSRIQTAMVAFMTLVHHWLGTWKNRINAYITLTQFSREKFIHSALALPKEKMMIKPNFVVDFGVGELQREPFFLFVGRLTGDKGIPLLLRAAACRKINFVIMGDGPLKSQVEQAAKEMPHIHFMGYQPQSMVLSYLKRCKALVFPSVCYEGIPISILEAYSTATPVIAGDVGAMKENVEHEMNGLLFDPLDVNDLVSKIESIIQSDPLAKRLSEGARASYLQKYTPSKNYERLLEIYNHVIESK